jgi:putative Mn2+ efflux pump MntP
MLKRGKAEAYNLREGSSLWLMLRLLLLLLPLGLDTVGVSISLGIKSAPSAAQGHERMLPVWIRSALLFSAAEMTMPLIGLAIGYAASLVITDITSFVGPLVLIIVGLWELIEEGRERLHKRNVQRENFQQHTSTPSRSPIERSSWVRQFLLALSVSIDELAIGFSLGAILASIPGGQTLHPLVLCLLIGVQSCLMTAIGLALGRTLRIRLKPVKEWSEIVSALLLIGLGIWLFLE